MALIILTLALVECNQQLGSYAGPASARAAQPFSPSVLGGQLQQRVPAISSGASATISSEQHCRIGAPPQWRSYLDAASKSYLAPAVSLATLKHFTLAPLQLAGSPGATQLAGPRQQPFHAQNVNNVGALIEATFQITRVLKRTRLMDLRPGQLVKLHYKVSASLSTTSDIIALANSGEQQAANWSAPTGASLQSDERPCALELTEAELRRGGKLFRVNQDYVLFLDQLVSVRRGPAARVQQQQATSATLFALHGGQRQPVRGTESIWQPNISWHPFASHEILANQTSRLIHRILCKNCGKF